MYKSFTNKENWKVSKIITDNCSISDIFTDALSPTPLSAQWDTGAEITFISNGLVRDMSLKKTGQTLFKSVNGDSKFTNLYTVDLHLRNGIIIPGVKAAAGPLRAHGIDILIGMDVISQGDFAFTNQGNKSCVSFRYPAHRHIDFEKEEKEDLKLQKQKQREAKKLSKKSK